MKFPDKYKIISSDYHSIQEYKLIPIRYEDRMKIMEWRNAQIYHLRQKELLTQEQQDNYFNEVVRKLFYQEYPEQILFSYLKDEECIGYGGLVHVDWCSRNAEISFIIDPTLEKECFNLHWKNYLSLLYKYAFDELNLHKLYTYAFDIRPNLYPALEAGGLIFESRLKKHFLFNNEYKDIIIHSKFNARSQKEIFLREVMFSDAELLFKWSNNIAVRDNSINSDLIIWKDHLDWFYKKLYSSANKMFIMEINNISVGQIRLDSFHNLWQISYSIDENFRGKGLGSLIIKLIVDKFPDFNFIAQVKKNNIASKKALMQAGFIISEKQEDNLETYILYNKR